ncbi:MAG: hypothetical protein H6742_03200 [Alphaproteobacteria bacterium]|nr:hypothetical protein [Alphaproteobacteria bacterium]
MNLLILFAALLAPVLAATPATGLSVETPAYSDGLTLSLSWTAPDDAHSLILLRSDQGEAGPWHVAAGPWPGTKAEHQDKVTTDPTKTPPAAHYWYRLVSLDEDTAPPPEADGDDAAAAEQAYVAALLAGQPATAAVQGTPVASWLSASPGYLLLLALIVSVGGLMLWFTDRARKGHEMFIRRMPGIDAIEEGIGRATEMGKPVLYVPGIDELQDIQTIASMLILGQISRKVAEYQSDIVVSCCIPIVREVADEVVGSGYMLAGYPDAYNPKNVRFISSEQFAFTAGTNGIILREKPATHIFLGRFFAESLILAETGYVNRSVQIAGTAEATQLPFFVAACDYTLIGEELFAVSAYLSKDPRLVSSLKASDYVKVFVVVMLVVGTIAASFGSSFFIELFTISG